LHTAPNTIHPKGELASYWRTIAEDFHWHIEILPILEQRSKSYSIKEVYFNSLLPEQAADRLRQLDPSATQPPSAPSNAPTNAPASTKTDQGPGIPPAGSATHPSATTTTNFDGNSKIDPIV
jgi:hypothetical protein